jgi:hypothetical protein
VITCAHIFLLGLYGAALDLVHSSKSSTELDYKRQILASIIHHVGSCEGNAAVNLKNKFLLIYVGGMVFAIVGLVLGSAILALTAFFVMITAFVVWNVLRRR